MSTIQREPNDKYLPPLSVQVGPYMPGQSVEIVLTLPGIGELFRMAATGTNANIPAGVAYAANTEYWVAPGGLGALASTTAPASLAMSLDSQAYSYAALAAFIGALPTTGTLAQASPAWQSGRPTVRSDHYILQRPDTDPGVPEGALLSLILVTSGYTLIGIGWHKMINPTNGVAFQWNGVPPLTWTWTYVGSSVSVLDIAGYYVLESFTTSPDL